MKFIKYSGIAVLFLSCLAPAYAKDKSLSALIPAHQAVAGRSQAEWSIAWWQWAASFDRSESPVADESGELCGAKQAGPVWFLAGTYGTRRTVRHCKIPKDKYLFFPLINYVVTRRANREVSCASVAHEARKLTNEVQGLVLELDGQRMYDLVGHRLESKCFNIAERTEPKQFIFPTAANGYYLMLKPLEPGVHTLNFGGALPSMLQAVTYTLEVE